MPCRAQNAQLGLALQRITMNLCDLLCQARKSQSLNSNCILQGLKDPNVAVRRGSAMALGALPAMLLRPRSAEVLQRLGLAAQVIFLSITLDACTSHALQ